MNLLQTVTCASLLVGCGQVESAADGEGTGGQPGAHTTSCDADLDLNGDGFADLVVPEGYAYGDPTFRATVYAGGPTGLTQPQTFDWPATTGHNLIAFSLGDARGVGTTDVAFTPYHQGAAEPICGPTQVLRSDNGSLALYDLDVDCEQDRLPAGYAYATPIGDLDGDGSLETAAWNDEDGVRKLDVLKDTGEILATHAEEFSGGREYLAAGDVDGDGIHDLIAYPKYGNETSITIFRGAYRSLGQPQPFATLSLPGELFGSLAPLGDVNADGVMDFIASSTTKPTHTENEHFLALSRFDRTQTQYDVKRLINGSFRRVTPAGDINCDGHDDFYAKVSSPALGADALRLEVWFGNSDGIAQSDVLTVPSGGNGTDILPVYAPWYAR